MTYTFAFLSGSKNNLRVLFVVLAAMFATVSSGRAGQSLSASPIENAARGLIERVLPKQASYFVVEMIPADQGRDVFEVASRGDKIILRGNNGVSIASALNWYLQHECHCDISWNCGNQLNLPEPLPVVSEPVRVVSPYKYRYAYNFCTHGYVMAWWQWPQWQRELDYLALKGINLALVIEGQESVWINTFANFGYTRAEIRDWVPDPAHLPWFEMDNLESYGGPLSPELVERRLKLGQKILARMRELGIEPMLPGYYGMVPPDFHKRFPKADVRLQGKWDALKRPDILNPADPMFPGVAAAYYAAQRHFFGGAKFYDADPFHEGGNTTGFDLPATGRVIFNAMNAAGTSNRISAPPDGATWVLQSWEKNPRPEMIAGLDKNRLLVLDLWCEAQENWRLRTSFDEVPWLWCMVETFGGNVGLGGHLDEAAAGPVRAFADPRHGRMSGIGATMEGSQLNPMIWELFFGNAWRTNAPDLKDWLADYAWRRYGARIPAADQAWQILAATVYHAPPSLLQLPINAVICARPSLNPNQNAREWGSTQLYYDPTEVVKAWKLLLAAAPEAGSSDGYGYDLCDVSRQALADLGARYNRRIIAAYKAHDAVALRRDSDKMLGLIRDLDKLVGTRREFLLGVWLADARSWGSSKTEKNLCERNARELLTTWTRHDNVTDYANRQWNGLLGKFYYHRWAMWLQALNDSLAGGEPIDEPAVRRRIRDWELWWTRQSNGHFAVRPHGNTIAISQRLFQKYGQDLQSSTAGKASPE